MENEIKDGIIEESSNDSVESVDEKATEQVESNPITWNAIESLMNSKFMEFKETFFMENKEDTKEEKVEEKSEEENYNDW